MPRRGPDGGLIIKHPDSPQRYALAFDPGDRVSHPHFGAGTILAIDDSRQHRGMLRSGFFRVAWDKIAVAAWEHERNLDRQDMKPSLQELSRQR